ncbi:MAG: TIGR03032 family protein [Chromatiales bacterium]|nr:TIGR03032 family protein [Chromatiales bacterium]
MSASTNRTPRFSIAASRHFAAWLLEQQASLAFTTYQTGKLFLVGVKRSGRISYFSRNFSRAMGVWSDGQTLWLGTRYQIWRLVNFLAPGQRHDGEYDRLYVPLAGYTLGDIDIHDVTQLADGSPIFVNTLFSCLAGLSTTKSFTPLWRPPFISALKPEDRCHLNGLAADEQGPAFVTSVSRSDVAGGWRQRRSDGGLIMDVRNNEVIAEGLSMPHSPRLHQGRLYFLESGTGHLCRLDTDSGALEQIAFLPGYVRGLAFVGNYAVVTSSKIRSENGLSGLALDRLLNERGADARCGVFVVDLRSGSLMHWIGIEGVMSETFDIAVLPNTRCPKALGFKSDEIERSIRVEGQLWLADKRNESQPTNRNR